MEIRERKFLPLAVSHAAKLASIPGIAKAVFETVFWADGGSLFAKIALELLLWKQADFPGSENC